MNTTTKTINTINTHFRPDADALLAVWAARRTYWDLPVHFVPVSFGSRKTDVLEEDCLYLDLSCGIKEADGKSAALIMVEQLLEKEKRAMLPLAEFVSRSDTASLTKTERAFREEGGFTINTAINSLKEVLTDEELVEAVSVIFDGYLSMRLKDLKAKELAQDAKWIGDVVIVEQDQETDPSLIFGVDRHLPRKPKAIVTKIGMNLGVKRLDESLNLTQLDLEPGWFQHPAGFMASWGDLSGKNRQASEWPKTSAIKLAEVVNVL